MNTSHVQSLEPQWFFPLFVLMGVTLFVLMGVTICSLLSLIGGWHELAQQYRASTDNPGKKFRSVSGAVGWKFFPVNYGNCLVATVGNAGLGLSILFLFRILHPRLFIPWSAIESVEQRRFLFMRRTAITIRGFSRRVVLFGRVGEEVSEVFNKVRANRVRA